MQEFYLTTTAPEAAQGGIMNTEIELKRIERPSIIPTMGFIPHANQAKSITIPLSEYNALKSPPMREPLSSKKIYEIWLSLDAPTYDDFAKEIEKAHGIGL